MAARKKGRRKKSRATKGSSKRRTKKRRGKKKSATRKGKGRIPLKVLEKRARKLNKIVTERGGSI